MDSLNIKQTQLTDSIPLLDISGQLDAQNFEQLEKVFDSYFNKGVYNIVADISQLTYISSAGAGVFIGAAGRAQANEGNIVLVNPQDNVQEIFDLLGICHIFPVIDTQQKALAHFTASQS